MKIENANFVLSKSNNNMYEIKVKNNDKLINYFLKKLNSRHDRDVKFFESDKRNKFIFKATQISTLEHFFNSPKSTINYSILQEIMKSGKILIDALEKHNNTVIDFELKDFLIVINGEIEYNTYDVKCIFVGFDKVVKFKNTLEIDKPFKKTLFIAPEIMSIKSLPITVDYPIKSMYFSLANICVYLLVKRIPKNYDEYKISLEQLENSKLYWMILRCVSDNPEDRYLLFI